LRCSLLSHKRTWRTTCQRTSDEGYLVAQTVQTGERQIIKLPAAVDPNSPTAADDEVIRQELVKGHGEKTNEVKRVPDEGICDREWTVLRRGQGETGGVKQLAAHTGRAVTTRVYSEDREGIHWVR
jgi:hypothetical protein